MAQTRGATGHSKPRVVTAISTEPERKRTTKPKKSRSKKVTTGGVTKKRAPATHKRKPSVKDKVAGAAEKVAGKVEKKPGKQAAGSRKMKGTDGKRAKGTKATVTSTV